VVQELVSTFGLEANIFIGHAPRYSVSASKETAKTWSQRPYFLGGVRKCWPTAPKPIRKMMQRCWHAKPAKRPKMADKVSFLLRQPRDGSSPQLNSTLKHLSCNQGNCLVQAALVSEGSRAGAGADADWAGIFGAPNELVSVKPWFSSVGALLRMFMQMRMMLRDGGRERRIRGAFRPPRRGHI
jgi:hypothetical protein